MNRNSDISTERTARPSGGRVRRAAASPGSVHQCYSYGYDGLNRLVSAAYSAGSGGMMPMSTAEYVALNDRDYSCTYSYDVNGNVTSLRRKGIASAVDDGGTNIYITYGDIDDLSLTYDGNRLSKVSDAADALTYAGAMDFRDGADLSAEYTYDANGNMTSDLNKGISLIRYNVLNLPGYVQFADGHSVTYTYDADGNKLRTVSGANVIAVLPDLENSPVTQAALDDVGQITGPVSSLSTREYCGGHVYADGRLERTLQPWGYTGADGADYFYITDYLGNVRTVTDRHGYACELNAYYPYGALMNTLSGNGTRQPYKYGGKELDRTAGLDLYDSQARFYDPVLGRTTTVDPKSAAYAGTSHYAWCAGNPVRFVDPDGEKYIFSNISDQDKATIKKMMERASNNAISVVFNDNELKVTRNTKVKQNIIGDIILKYANKPENTIINVSNDSKVVIGDADSKTIDLNDISNLGTEGPANDIGALMHELVEQYILQKATSKQNLESMDDDYWNRLKSSAHNRATNTESVINSVIINPDRMIDWDERTIDFKYNPDNTKPQDSTLIFPNQIVIRFDPNKNIIKR